MTGGSVCPFQVTRIRSTSSSCTWSGAIGVAPNHRAAMVLAAVLVTYADGCSKSRARAEGVRELDDTSDGDGVRIRPPRRHDTGSTSDSVNGSPVILRDPRSRLWGGNRTSRANAARRRPVPALTRSLGRGELWRWPGKIDDRAQQQVAVVLLSRAEAALEGNPRASVIRRRGGRCEFRSAHAGESESEKSRRGAPTLVFPRSRRLHLLVLTLPHFTFETRVRCGCRNRRP